MSKYQNQELTCQSKSHSANPEKLIINRIMYQIMKNKLYKWKCKTDFLFTKFDSYKQQTFVIYILYILDLKLYYKP